MENQKRNLWKFQKPLTNIMKVNLILINPKKYKKDQFLYNLFNLKVNQQLINYKIK